MNDVESHSYPLHVACEQRDIRTLKRLLQEGTADCRDNEGRTAFDTARGQGDVASVLLLQVHHADLRRPHVLREILLHALQNGHDLLAELMIRFGADTSMLDEVEPFVTTFDMNRVKFPLWT